MKFNIDICRKCPNCDDVCDICDIYESNKNQTIKEKQTMNIPAMKRDHEWLLSQGFTSSRQPVCAMCTNAGCYAYSKTVFIRGVNNNLTVIKQTVLDEECAWAAKLNSTAPIFNGSSANIGVGCTPKAAIENLAYKENVPIQTIIDVDKLLEEVPNLPPEEKRRLALEYLMSLTPDAFADLLNQKMRSSMHAVPIDGSPMPGTMLAEDATAYCASDLVEKTFKKSATAMGMLGGEAWLLDHGFRREDPSRLYSCVIFKWMWSGWIGGKERRIRVADKVTVNDENSWSAELVENNSGNNKCYYGSSPMAALDELLRKYGLLPGGEQP